MKFTATQIANIERVGYISTTKASMQLHVMEIHDVIWALQIEMSTYQTDKKAALAKILWDCYMVIDKRYEKIEDTGKRKGSVSLLLSHWLTLYQFLLEFKFLPIRLIQCLEK